MKVERHSKIIEIINKYDIETQEELADSLAISTRTLSRYENGLRAAPLDFLFLRLRLSSRLLTEYSPISPRVLTIR